MLRQPDSINRLQAAGFSYEDACALRRISMTLHRWHELDCGTGEGQTTFSVERDGDEPDSKPFMRMQYPSHNGYVDKRWPIPDREACAKRRLAAIMARHPDCRVYIQSDPRGCALYILTPEMLARWPDDQDLSTIYSSGVAVYK